MLNFACSSLGWALVPQSIIAPGSTQQMAAAYSQMLTKGNQNLSALGSKSLGGAAANTLSGNEPGSPQKVNKIESLSDIEEYFAKTLTEETEVFQFKSLKQFGYDIFN